MKKLNQFISEASNKSFEDMGKEFGNAIADIWKPEEVDAALNEYFGAMFKQIGGKIAHKDRFISKMKTELDKYIK